MAIYKYLIIIVVLCFSTRVQAQRKYCFKTILNIKAINKTFINKSNEDTTWRTYLGRITNDKNQTLIYIIKEFNKVKAASTWHGHSNVYFFNPNGKMIARFDVALPENLPTQLHKNALYFPDDKIADKVHKVRIANPLPKNIFIKLDWCNEVIFL